MSTQIVVVVYDHGSGRVLPWVVSKAVLDRIVPPEPEKPERPERPEDPQGHDYVCSECGTEQDSMRRPCVRCGSVRVVAISALEDIMGTDWRDQLRGDRV